MTPRCSSPSTLATSLTRPRPATTSRSSIRTASCPNNSTCTGATVAALRAQAHSYKSPEMDLEDLLGRLASAGVPKFAPRRDATCRNTMLTATKAKTRMSRHRDTRARHRVNSCLSRTRLRVLDKACDGSICPAQRLVRTLSVAVRATGHETAPAHGHIADSVGPATRPGGVSAARRLCDAMRRSGL